MTSPHRESKLSRVNAVIDSLIDRSDVAIPIHAVAPDGLEAVLASIGDVEAAWARSTGFDAAAGAVTIIADTSGVIGKVLFGLGRPDSRRPAPLITGKLPMILPQGDYEFVGDLPDPALGAVGWALGNYRFERYKTSSAPVPRLVVPRGADSARARGMARAITMVRDLINTPASDLGPAELSAAIHSLGARFGASVSEIVGRDLISANLPMIHAVGRAADADREPRLVDLVWGDPSHPKVTLVGKGVTFDTGGLDIKPLAR